MCRSDEDLRKNYSKSYLDSISYHEAGHAVLYWLLGSSIHEINMCSQDSNTARVIIAYNDLHYAQWHRKCGEKVIARQFVLRELLAILAGPCAQLTYDIGLDITTQEWLDETFVEPRIIDVDTFSNDIQQYSSDIARVWNALNVIFPEESRLKSKGSQVLRMTAAWTHEIVQNPIVWSAITNLASYLPIGTVLDSPDIQSGEKGVFP